MDKKRIEQLLIDPAQASHHDLYELERIATKYPYAQFIHILISKISKQLNTDYKEDKLHIAAIYSNSRAILRQVITDMNFGLSAAKPITIYQNDLSRRFEMPAEDTQEAAVQPAPEKTVSVNIFEEVLKNLETLKSLRKQYDILDKETSAILKRHKSKSAELKKQDKTAKTKTEKKEKEKKE